ncbi:MAG: hypothetical protein A2W93_15700 [Bacteroidetes bacterium GWF2_43_63]|nr:MAG: hypothetical protein A2W94_13690 [Bacteroidetes bacterium GWE2_42_42]OFY53113.1 MAG: hypothetical protein A2W93_15700 [Bacteroidetes bacterium GWF2_43_63]HBG70374.1 hypothetical protein [Bacteroidales bacterium]HCB60579.1 hypothetical protein [Bacteroidales bacterium]HCY22948.1 hypothetical protein [Bacteroidales bacterium]
MKAKFIFIVAILLLSGNTAFSQVTIGTGTSEGQYPFTANWKYVRSASLYTAAEIGSYGSIQSLAWYVSTSWTGSVPIKIYLKTTTATSITSSTWATMISGATLVYDGTANFGSTGWKTIDITDFNYCIDNLLVLCESNVGTACYPKFRYTTSTNMHMTLTSDASAPAGSGTVGSARPNIQMTIGPSTVGCSGTPTGGTVAASLSNVCPNISTLLSVTGASVGCGLVYQWQSSTDNTNWTDIPGATGMSYSTTLSATTYFRRITTCSDNSQSSPSTSVQVTLNPVASCYCTSTFTNMTDEWISNVTFNTINNTTGQAGATSYGNYTGLSTTVNQGNSYSLSVTFVSSYTQDVFAWFDWNQDGDFTDAGEQYQLADNITAPTTNTITVNVPSSAALGNTRMRIMTYEYDDPGPCQTAAYGETEDYTINITGPVPMAYSSCTTTQTVTSDIGVGALYQQIIGVQIVTTGSSSPLSASSFTFNITGTTSAADICNARLWSTGNSSVFATSVMVGNTEASPAGTFTINAGANMPFTLVNGTNYFWLTYDVTPTAVVNNYVDAECTSITIGGIACTPAVTAPAGRRQIKDLCTSGIGTGYVTVAALPYSVASQTTSGMANNLTSTTASVCGSSSYYAGLDVVYKFTPATSGNVTITLTSAGTNTALVLYDGCPIVGMGGSCVSYSQSATGNKSMCVAVTAGHVYYLLLDNSTATAVTYSLSISAPAAALANDDPCGATLLASATTCTYSVQTNLCAGNSLSVPAPTCGNYAGADVWFRVVVPADGAITIDTQTGDLTDAAMALYTGPDCSNLTFLECDDDDSDNGYMPKISRSGLTPGSSVWIRIWDLDGNLTGAFSICALEAQKCPAGLGTGVISGISLPYSQTSTTCGAVNDVAGSEIASLCGSTSYYAGEEVVYSFTAASSGSVTFNLASTGTYTGMMLFDGCPFSGTCVGYQQSSSGDKNMCVGVIAGHTYYLILDNSSTGACYPYTLNISGIAAGLANDDPCGATMLSVGSSCSFSPVTNACAGTTTSVPAPVCGTFSGGDVWFKAIVPASGSVAFDTEPGTVLDGSMAVYTGPDCNSLTLLDCDVDDSENGLMPKIVLHNQTPGSTIWVRCWEAGNDNNGTFGICATNPPAIPSCATNPAAGDLCLTATPICNLNGYCGNTSGDYTVDAPGNLGSLFCGTIENNSWLSFVAEESTVTLNIWVMNCLNNWGIQMEIYGSSDCNTYTSFSNCWNPGVMVDGTVTGTGLTPGQKYYLMIDGYSGDICDYVIGAGSGSGVMIPDAGIDQSITPPDCATLSASGGTSYAWSANPADPSLSPAETTQQTISVCPTVQTTYTVSVTGGNPLCPSNGTDEAIVFINSALPVAYLSMDAVCNGEFVRVNWSTASQINCDYFVVEKSVDGQSFIDIRTIHCAGNSNSVLNYSVKDDNVTTHINYYRIRQVDIDGKTNYSQVMTAQCENNSVPFAVAGSYSNSQVFVRFDGMNGKQYVVSLFDMAGKRVYSELYIAGADETVELKVPAENLMSGMYLIKVESENESGNQKIIIE